MSPFPPSESHSVQIPFHANGIGGAASHVKHFHLSCLPSLPMTPFIPFFILDARLLPD